MEKKYQSEALMVNHQSAESLFRLGEISEAEMREFDELCLTKKALKDKTAHGAATNVEHTDLVTA
jgi:DNA-binding transcriptional regulator YiaG